MARRKNARTDCSWGRRQIGEWREMLEYESGSNLQRARSDVMLSLMERIVLYQEEHGEAMPDGMVEALAAEASSRMERFGVN